MGSNAGWWNSCWAWSAVYSLGLRRAYIDFDMHEQMMVAMHNSFAYVVGFSMLFQIVLAVGMVWTGQGAVKLKASRDEEAEEVFVLQEPAQIQR